MVSAAFTLGPRQLPRGLNGLPALASTLLNHDVGLPTLPVIVDLPRPVEEQEAL